MLNAIVGNWKRTEEGRGLFMTSSSGCNRGGVEVREGHKRLSAQGWDRMECPPGGSSCFERASRFELAHRAWLGRLEMLVFAA
jgi:hypothetical protein